jgi:hypothetical protein
MKRVSSKTEVVHLLRYICTRNFPVVVCLAAAEPHSNIVSQMHIFLIFRESMKSIRSIRSIRSRSIRSRGIRSIRSIRSRSIRSRSIMSISSIIHQRHFCSVFWLIKFQNMSLVIRVRNSLTGVIVKSGIANAELQSCEFWGEDFTDFEVLLAGVVITKQPVQLHEYWNLYDSSSKNVAGVLEFGLIRKGSLPHLLHFNIRDGQPVMPVRLRQLGLNCTMEPPVRDERHAAGWRRWYKEFRSFCINVPMVVDIKDGLEIISFHGDEYQVFGGNPRDLVPLILQAHVAQCRSDEAGRLLIRTAGFWFRSRAGALHGIVKRSNAEYKLVLQWVVIWEEMNHRILSAIEAAVKLNPSCSYFK